jgi:hypothetical protein
MSQGGKDLRIKAPGLVLQKKYGKMNQLQTAKKTPGSHAAMCADPDVDAVVFRAAEQEFDTAINKVSCIEAVAGG